ncbi:hypothetical protein PMAYCL1PPCAC_23039, partial [Pristionchus mayeri]
LAFCCCFLSIVCIFRVMSEPRELSYEEERGELTERASDNKQEDSSSNQQIEDSLKSDWEKQSEHNLKEWSDLLKYDKLAPAVVSSLVYIGNALCNSGIVQVQLKINDEGGNREVEKRAKHDGSSVNPFEPSNIDVDRYAETFANFLNEIPILKKKRGAMNALTSWISWPSSWGKWKHSKSWIPGRDDLVSLAIRCYKKYYATPKKLPWSHTIRSIETEKLFKKLFTFLVEGKIEDLSEEVARMLLYAVISMGHGFHKKIASPLHETTKSRDLDALIMLLSHEVDVNAFDGTGYTALFYAINDHFNAEKSDYTVIVKTLLVFGSNLSKRELMDGRKMEKVSEKDPMSDEMKKIIRDITTSRHGSVIVQNEDSNLLRQPNREKGKKTHLLSLDGGGIKGLVLTTILSELNKAIPGIFEKIHWLAGTSTGSILGMALASGKTIDECRNLYFKLKDVGFTPSTDREVGYDSSILEKFLKETYRNKDTTWIRLCSSWGVF